MHTESTTLQIESLLKKLNAGDVEARTALISLAQDRLLLLTSRMLTGYPRGREHDDTTGIFNESYLRLHQALEEVKPTNVRQFLGLAALEIRRTLLDIIRKLTGRGKEKRKRNVSIDAQISEGEPAIEIGLPDQTAKQFELMQDLFVAVDQLPEKYREVVMLHHFQGLTQAEVGAILGVHEDTVKSWWAVAQVKLAKLLTAYDPNS